MEVTKFSLYSNILDIGGLFGDGTDCLACMLANSAYLNGIDILTKNMVSTSLFAKQIGLPPLPDTWMPPHKKYGDTLR